MDCLIIKEKYLQKILSGKKTWEIRGSKTHKRGRIGLIQSGSGKIIGECELIDCIKLDLDTYLKNQDKHCSENTTLTYKQTYAWVLKSPIRYTSPKPYTHPQGAIIWVKTKYS